MIHAEFGYALDSDGPVGDVIVAAPTQVKVFAKLHGKTAHAGVAPEKGVSAITMASKAISRMPLGRIDEETTANIGRFSGGDKTNIVCDYVEVLAEARSLDQDKVEQQVKKMVEAFEAVAAEMGGRLKWKQNLCIQALNEMNQMTLFKSPKQPLNKSIVRLSLKRAAAEVMLILFLVLGFQRSTWR